MTDLILTLAITLGLCLIVALLGELLRWLFGVDC